MTDTCVNHPQNAAVEACEVCARPLCGLCLWYTDDGHRLCARHAQEREASGETVLPPHTYQEAFAAGVRPRQRPAVLYEPGYDDDRPVVHTSPKVYKGNNNDLLSLVAVVLGFVTLGSCFGGVYCMPFLALALGAIAYFNAEQSVDPDRTRRMALIGLGTSLVLFLALAAFAFLYFFFIIMAFAVGSAP